MPEARTPAFSAGMGDSWSLNGSVASVQAWSVVDEEWVAAWIEGGGEPDEAHPTTVGVLADDALEGATELLVAEEPLGGGTVGDALGFGLGAFSVSLGGSVTVIARVPQPDSGTEYLYLLDSPLVAAHSLGDTVYSDMIPAAAPVHQVQSDWGAWRPFPKTDTAGEDVTTEQSKVGPSGEHVRQWASRTEFTAWFTNQVEAAGGQVSGGSYRLPAGPKTGRAASVVDSSPVDSLATPVSTVTTGYLPTGTGQYKNPLLALLPGNRQMRGVAAPLVFDGAYTHDQYETLKGPRRVESPDPRMYRNPMAWREESGGHRTTSGGYVGPPRAASLTGMEVVRFSFDRAQSVNRMSFDLLNVPCRWTLWYMDPESGRMRAVHDGSGTIGGSVAGNLELVRATQKMSTHDAASQWVKAAGWKRVTIGAFPAVSTQVFELRLDRNVPNPPVDRPKEGAEGMLVPYAVGMRNVQFGYVFMGKQDVLASPPRFSDAASARTGTGTV